MKKKLKTIENNFFYAHQIKFEINKKKIERKTLSQIFLQSEICLSSMIVFI